VKKLIQQGKAKHLVFRKLERKPSAAPQSSTGDRLQSEYSLWWREPEADILPTLEELGIGSFPSARWQGLPHGAINENTKFSSDDFATMFRVSVKKTGKPIKLWLM